MNPSETPTPCWMTVNQVAERLQVNPSTVRRWLAQGNVLHAVRIGKTTLRVDFNSLMVQTVGGAA